MNKPSRRQALAIVGVTVATVMVAAAMLGDGRHGRAIAQDANAGTGAKAHPVEAVKPIRRTVNRDLRMPATLLARETTDIYAKTSGYVAAVRVDIGDRVQQAAVLLEVDVPEMHDELRQAEAVLAAKRARVEAMQAKAAHAELMIESARARLKRFEAEYQLGKLNLERQTALRQGNAVPQQALDDAQSKLAVAEAQLLIAKAGIAAVEAEKRSALADVAVAEAEVVVAEADVARLRTLMAYASLRAPFSGVITRRMVDTGAFVRSAADGATTPLLTIDKTDRIRLVLDIPEPDAPFVRVGTAVQVFVQALGDEPLTATVSRTSFALNPKTRTMRAEVDLDNADGRLAPGMYAQVVVQLESTENALVIPSKAVRVRDRDLYVLVVDGGLAQKQPVSIGYDDGIWVQILEGLDGSETIITSAGSAVGPATPVVATLKPTSGV
ncbi:MAG: efflux RND transporter periplasmic adaptor subunit [bacterium]|nr:efflux RND transporter periplasmic adaptor subunit [bacterium]